jgi:putative protein-disulfide isomerase
LSGQPFGEGYTKGLLFDTEAIMDSEPPITAILAAEKITGSGLNMLHHLQSAHYVEGRRICEMDVLVSVAVGMDLEAAKFRNTFGRLSGQSTQQHINDSLRQLHEVGGHGFPSFALEQEQGRITLLYTGEWLGKPDAWKDYLIKQTPSTTSSGSKNTILCYGPDSCAI